MRLFPQKSACCYTPYYCEENVWKLCESASRLHQGALVDRCYAVFISNSRKMIPMWHQRANANSYVIWDYHVIFLQDDRQEVDGHCWVYDLDCTLDDFPVTFDEYLSKAVREESDFHDDVKRRFRVVPAAVFLENFSSDRSHMIGKEDGKYVQPPPDYPAIRTTACDNNLDSFIAMDEGAGWGRVMTFDEFRELPSRTQVE